MFYDFPYTDFHELNLDYLLCLCKKSMGLKLEVVGDTLRLVNANHEVISNVTISYAEKALNDVDGKPIKTYILSAGTDGTHVVFTKGDGTVTSIEVPYAEKAKEDLQGKDILDYVYNVSVAGDKLRITKGDLTVAEITVPFATKASTDPDGKEIVTYAASLAAEGNQVVLRDAKGRYLNRITVPYATEAGEAAHAADADTADYATEAGEAAHADVADLATLATDATNAVESVTISGDNMVFTTYGGRNFTITCPYSVKAQKDELGNNIKSTYVANVTNDPQTGEISFLDATGHEIVALIPTVNKATNDSYNNLIADYVKAIAVSSGSDYVTVTHGTGATDSIKIHYSDTAWKDTNGNVIKNTYIKRLACEEDVQDGHYKLVAYNGDTPEAELFRIPLIADAAKHDHLGNVISEYYAHSLAIPGSEPELLLRNGEGDTLSSVDLDKKLRLENLQFVGNAVGISDADLLHWKATGPLTGEWETLSFTNLSDGDVLTWDVTNNTWDAKAPARTTELSDLDDVDTTSVADGDVLTYDSTDQEWQPKAPFVPNGGYILDYVGTIPDNTLLATYLQQGYASSGVSYVFDKATKVVDGTTISGTISVSDLLKDGNVFVRVSYKYANNAVKKPIFIGQIMEKSGNFFVAYGDDMLTSVRWTGAHNKSEDDIVKIEDDGTFNSFTTYAPAYPIKRHATKPIIILTTEPGSGSTGGVPVKRSTSVTPADLWNHLIIGSPMPALYVNSADPDRVLATVKSYNEVSSFEVTKGSGTDMLLLVADIADLVSQMTNANSVLTLKFIYKNVDDFDGHKYDYKVSFTVTNVTLNANLNNDFTFSDYIITRTQVT